MADLRLRVFFDPVTHNVELLREMGSQGTLNVDDVDALEPLFVALLRENPQVSAVMLADDRGHEFFVLRKGDRWTSRQTRRDEWNDSQTLTSWQAGSERKISQETSDYDPRQRPWFRQALRDVPTDSHIDSLDHATANIHWTRPYRFFSERTPGITASAWFCDAAGRKCVVAFDVLLSDLQAFTESMQVVRHGTLAFVDNFGWPIESPEEFEATASERESMPPTANDFTRAETFAAVQALSSQSSAGSAISFTHAKRTWWADSQPFRLSAARKWEAVIVIPESDYTGGLSTIRMWVAVISGSVLALAITWAIRFADRVGRPLEALVHASEQISLGNLDEPALVKSNFKEVSDLAAAQEEMRTALRTLVKHDRDLKVAREIQQSTFPTKFPSLDKFQIAGWSEPAEETGGDTFDVVSIEADDSSKQTVYLMLADASGHGIGPALSAVRIHSLFRVAIEKCDNVVEITDLINRQLCRSLPTGRFATTWVASLDPITRQLDSFSAGQGPILWFSRKTGDVEIVLEPDTLPCGILADADMPGGRTQCLAPGDLLAVISDGIFEARGANDELFGADRVAGILQNMHTASADEILAAIRNEVDQYTGGAEADDDRTIIILKCVKE
jgi:serine phosphatase RsbU (regulator of sigma subunit)